MTTLTDPAVFAAPLRWTRDDVRRMEEIGLLEGRKYELVEGVLVSTMGKGILHGQALLLLLEALRAVFGNRRLYHEHSIEVTPEDSFLNEPEPDVAVLRRSALELTNLPRPADIDLIVEVSVSTAQFDLGPKARLYARAGIPEYWVLDLAAKCLIVHREPRQGVYSSITTLEADATVEPLAALGNSVPVAKLLP